jgi:hypothetical protein
MTRCADKFYMKNRTQQIPAFWLETLDRDDRLWLKSLFENGFSLDSTDPETDPFPLLMDIVTSVELQGHSSSLVATPLESVKNLSEKFWRYLIESGELEKLHHLWGSDNEGPWSLPFFLLRRLLIFRKHQKKLTSNDNSIIQTLERSIIDAFQTMTENLPIAKHQRLVYQLHMEGLVEIEIAALTGLSKVQVIRSLGSAKKMLKNELTQSKKG